MSHLSGRLLGRCAQSSWRFAALTALSIGCLTTAALAQGKPGAPQPGAGAPTAAAPDLGAFGTADAAPPADPKPPLQAPSAALGLDLGYVPEFTLHEVTEEEWNIIRAEDAQRALVDKVLRYGFRRDVGADALNAGKWLEIPDVGHLWVADVVVPLAVGVRLQFAGMRLPDGAQLFVYSTEYPERVWGPYEATGVTPEGEFWTPTTFGERVRLEYFVPVGTERVGKKDDPTAIFPEELLQPAFQVPACQQIYLDPVADHYNRVGACHNDVTCYPAWANTAKASAGIGTIDQNSLWCSGTMITTTNSDQTPYWLTANHCISSAATATNAEIYWLYQTSTCNGAPPSIASVPQSAVCTRLSNSATSDYSLLMVEGTIPNGLYWAGWTSTAVANGTNVTCIHHPDGSWKRISFATKVSGAAANFIRADWYDAPTEPGSSGSGLFRDDTQQLVGQLYGGPSSCADESYDDYGAFATSYNSISSYLSGGSDDAYENNDACASARAMTAGTYSNLVVKRYASGDEDWYSISVAAGATLTVTLSFTHARGDVDLQLYGTCGGAVLKSSTTTGNSESVSQTNSGGSATTYLVRVYLANDTRNTYSMTLSTGGGGGGNNDNCANATAVTNGTYSGSTAAATRDGSASCGTSSTTKDVWYKYTAPASGTLSVNSCGSGYDTVVSIHSGCPGTTTNQLNCNDDCGGSPCGGLNSCLSRSVTAGTTYYIRVSGYNGASGSFSLTVSGP